jgi:hypothetical protein
MKIGHSAYVAIVIVALSSRAPCPTADARAPEELLPSTTQAYVRWDGITAHQKAYDQSARGKMFAGETGQAFAMLRDVAKRQLKQALAGDPLLEGKQPEQLRQALADLKGAFGLPQLLARTGVVAGFEIRPPALDLSVLADLVRGRNKNRDKLTTPQLLLTVIVPDGAGAPEPQALVRLWMSKVAVKERMVDGRKVAWFQQSEDDPIIAAWAEDKHFVLTIGNAPLEKTVAKIKNSGAGVTNHPLFKQLRNFKEFEVVTRGFVDVHGAVSSFEKLIKAYQPEIWAIVEASGLSGLKSVCFWDGFEGEESRGVVELDMPGPRRGLTRVFKPLALKPADLPPLPADLKRFTAVRLDLAEIFDLGVLAAAGMNGLEAKDGDGKATQAPEERLQAARTQISREVGDFLGFRVTDLFAALGDRVVTYQAPSDGILFFGQVVAISVKDEAALRRCLEGFSRKLSGFSDKLGIKKRDCLDVTVTQFMFKANQPLTISSAICDGWLVIGMEAQPVRGFIHRARGKLPAWKPDPRTVAALAKAPADRCAVQVADPRASLQLIHGVAPLIAGLVGDQGENAIIDAGLFPHAGEASMHLFPNVMWCRDDGTVMRWESRDSLWLPLEFLGPEILTAIVAL